MHYISKMYENGLMFVYILGENNETTLLKQYKLYVCILVVQTAGYYRCLCSIDRQTERSRFSLQNPQSQTRQIKPCPIFFYSYLYRCQRKWRYKIENKKVLYQLQHATEVYISRMTMVKLKYSIK